MNYGKKEKAIEYREKFGWDMPTLKLARILHKENPLLFKDKEDARSSLRGIEGKFSHHKKIIDIPERPRNPYKLPESDETVYEPFIIKAKRVLVLSDIHIPYHSLEALTSCFDYARKEKPDAVLLNGDVLDFFQLSRFCKEPRQLEEV